MLGYTICLRKGKVEEKHSHPARDRLLRLHRFRKFPFSSVLMSTGKRCFQITSFWSAFLKSCIFGNCFHRRRVDEASVAASFLSSTLPQNVDKFLMLICK